MSYLSEHGQVFPSLIGEDYTNEQRDQLAEFLVSCFYSKFAKICKADSNLVTLLVLCALAVAQTHGRLQVQPLHASAARVFPDAMECARRRQRICIYMILLRNSVL